MAFAKVSLCLTLEIDAPCTSLDYPLKAEAHTGAHQNHRPGQTVTIVNPTCLANHHQDRSGNETGTSDSTVNLAAANIVLNAVDGVHYEDARRKPVAPTLTMPVRISIQRRNNYQECYTEPQVAKQIEPYSNLIRMTGF